jgi:membrane fusion protein, copper/silver efflux system
MRKAIVRAASYAAILAATVLAVYFTTRGDALAAPQSAGHNHGAPSASSAAEPIKLDDQTARRIGVTYAVAMREQLGGEVRSVGQITFDETRLRTITAKVDGWVESLNVNATGQFVRTGQPLMTIYSPMLVAAQEELLVARRLVGDVSSPEASRHASDLLASARKRLSYWDIPDEEIAEIERAGIARRTIVLRSNATGYVTEKNVVAGQRIMAGDPLYRVADLSTVWAEGEIFEQDLASVIVGQSVRADLDALPDHSRTGRIAYIYPMLNPETRTVRVRVVLGNPDMQLKPGMYATLRIAGAQPVSRVTVPRSAVLATGERSIVFVRESNGHLAPREVQLGKASDDRVEILRGLAVGETVVASATFLVDAESNLGTALGGMGNMPGMDVTTPPKPLRRKD